MKQTITIRTYISELLHDISQRVYMIGESVKTTDNPDLATLVQDVYDESQTTLLRAIGHAYAVVQDELGEYLISEHSEADNVLLDPAAVVPTGLAFGYQGAPSSEGGTAIADNTLVLMLRMPSNFAMDSRESIAKNIHAYLVDSALAEWLTLTPARELATQYAQSAAADMLLIHQAVNRRARPNRVHAPSSKEPTTNDIRYE